jgi:hypothetical protein
MGRTNWLVLVSVLGLAALAAWNNSSDAIIQTPPAVELIVPATPVPGTDVPPVAPSKDDAVIAEAKDAARAVNTKAPARVNRRQPPAAVTVTAQHRDDTVPPSAPAEKAPPARVLSYDQRVAAATTAAGEDPDRALLELQQLAKDEPGRPQAYEAMAGISLRKRDYGQARELIDSAFDRGGKATFRLIHDHSRGNFDAGDPKSTCVGELTIHADEVRFESPGNGDRFSATWSEVRDAGSNRFFGSGLGGFHLSMNTGGKYKNFNLAPESKDKAEGKLILELLTAYARRGDRTK